MQYVRSLGGSVSKTWNSINPATLSGAIDVVVVEQEDGSLACSPFHVRFGKFSLLRPSEKKVEFKVNGAKQNYSMKLGDGGEAFFVFETTDDIPEALQTSPLVSPATSPDSLAAGKGLSESSLQEPEFFDLSGGPSRRRPLSTVIQSQHLPTLVTDQRPQSDIGNITPISGSPPTAYARPDSGEWTARLARAASEELLQEISKAQIVELEEAVGKPLLIERSSEPQKIPQISSTSQARSTSPPPLSTKEAVNRAISLSKKLTISKIPTSMTDSGDLMLDMTGYKSSEEDALRAELIARKILSEELQGNYDIGALMGADEHGNVWIYSSEEAKEAAARKHALLHSSMGLSDAASDPGYHSDEERSEDGSSIPPHLQKVPSDQRAPGIVTPPQTPPEQTSAGDPNRNYAKTLRLTSDQLKALSLKMGANDMSFSVNRATCQASMFYWSYNVPVVISDIDGTITKSDALGHVLNMIGRDWTHLGVAKLYHDIAANGYNILYLTSRSVGQSDTTRAYLHGITQEGYKLPKGPVILSPDRTIAALRREVYLRKPEVFKMACLRDILNLFGVDRNPFYAGFGNRLTDAMSYRSVRIPQRRIFTINSNAEVSLDLLTFNKYKSSYVSIREIVDHFFPPVGLLIAEGGENFTDFNYWREPALDINDFSGSESDEESVYQKEADNRSIQSEDEGSEGLDDQVERMGESFMSRESVDETGDLTNSILESVENDEGDEYSRKDSFESFADSVTAAENEDRGRLASRNNE